MTAALSPGQVLVEDHLHQEPDHDIGADPGSRYAAGPVTSGRFQELCHPESTYLEKAPAAQLTRIDADDRLFSVPLTRITSVPECAVSSVGFLWGIGRRVAELWGFCGARRSSRLARPTRHGVPRYRDFRILMTTSE